MFGTSGSLRFVVGSVLFVLAISTCTVDGYFFESITGLAADIMRKPLESFSLFALKSYLLGHIGGRVTQYRQMMYNRPQQYSAMATNQYAIPSLPRSGKISSSAAAVNVHSRHRRSVIDDLEMYERVNADQKKAIEQDHDNTATSVQFLEMAEKLDVDKCIPRLICQVMTGNGITKAGEFEELVVKVLGNEIPDKKGDQNLFPSIYHYAAYVGKQATSGEACRELFPKCKASELEFRKMADKIFAGVDQEDDDQEQEQEQEQVQEVAVNDDDNEDKNDGLIEVLVPKEDSEEDSSSSSSS